MGPQNDAETRLRERGRLLISLLRHGKREHQRHIVLWGGLRIASVLAVGMLVLVIVGAAAPILPRPIGVALAIVAWVGLGLLLWRHWLRPLRAVPNLAVFSRLVEQRRDFRDMLRAALEFSERGVPAGGSADLTASTIDRAYDEANNLDLTSYFQFPDKRRDATLALVSVSCIVLLQLLVPAAPRRALEGLAFAYPSPASIVYGDLEVVGGDFEVLVGDDVIVRLRDHGPLAPEMTLRFNDTGDDLWKSRQLEPRSARAPWEYEFRFENVRDQTQYRFESGKRRTSDFDIQVVQRPIVNRFSLKLVPPAYTRRDPAVLEEGRGDAVALFGTQIEIEGTASTSLVEGWLVPESGATGERTLPHPLRLIVDGKGFAGSFTLRGDLRYHFSIADKRGHENTDPVTYQISAIDDRSPYVELRDPEGDAAIPKTLRVPLTVYASDDFGISRMTVVYQHERDGEPIGDEPRRANLKLHGPTALDPNGEPLGREPAPEVIKTFDWDLSQLGLYPGDAVTYFVEVEDNDEFSGHKTARTPEYQLRLPSLGELYADIQDQDDNRMSELDEVLDQGRELKEKYEQMARELKKRPEMDWKKEQEIEKALEKQQELAERVSELAEQLQDEVQRMEEQQLVNSEIAEKMEEIRELMENIQDESLREYMERLQEAMKQISPEEIQRSMEKLEMSQEEFLKRLERTKALLEQVAREQKLDSLVERTAEMLERQEELTDRTQELDEQMQQEGEPNEGEQQDGEEKDGEQQDGEQQDGEQKDGEPTEKEKQDAERLAQEQKQLAEEMKKLEEELAKLAEEMQQAERSELNDANEQMQQKQPSEQMQQASEQLQQQQPQEAQENQEESERRLRSLYEQLMQAQMAMSQNMSQEMAAALSNAARQSLDVSFRQEHLSRQGAPVGDYDSTGDLARRQNGLVAATDHVVETLDELAKESLQVPSHVSALLGQAMTKMEQGVDSYEKGNALAGRIHGEDAYGDLNRAVIELNRSARSCSQGGGGGQSSREKMGQMAQRQQQLNDATRRLQEALQDPQRLTPQEREAMSRLLGEQRSIQEQLRDIERQAHEQRDLLGRMDELLDEVKEVVENMESESLGDGTSRVQERILSRMLQAQRSLHKRDYNKQRESRSVDEVYSEGGSALQESDDVKKLRRDILRALESGTPEEYQELVRQYFRAIADGEEKSVP